MSARRDSLSPPDRTNTADPGARELDSSESEDHFSDAQSAPQSLSASPIPRLRVEKTSNEPSYGEVPGTEAYKLRREDAEPDEIAVVPEEEKAVDEEKDEVPRTPGGRPIPRTVVEETSGNSESQSHPEKKYTADAPPDLVLKAGESSESEGQEGTDVQEQPITPTLSSPHSGHSRRDSSDPADPAEENTDGADDEGLGDDFDDFEEGDEDADFDDFDDGFQEPEEMPATPASPPSSAPAIQPLSFPIPDFDAMGMEDILATTEPYLNALFSTAAEADDITITPPPKDNPIFLTPRSASLWSQLVAPPPLQPPDWIRSRIRRLFLVSLGVPVDLDEILPASKQKKLVLPSVHSPRTSSDSRRSQSKTPTRLRDPQQGQDGAGNNNSSNNNSGDAPRTGTKRKAPPPEFDLVSAKQLCSTTDEALGGMTDGELRAHVARLEAMEGTARGVLSYWQQRTDEQVGEREAFEGVIENLVKHARKTRK
ncbi:hypothetical protein VPNG_00152 [Cytospora leucostoma]|uniref:Uncharacterized protein n=1 Tax=Cytospora leucostoma TaxID=1230097 RepID=A0A423XNM1_9PEZI|nr:hypothetical protein VPNG_00152 [Cytospora leucostoma]